MINLLTRFRDPMLIFGIFTGLNKISEPVQVCLRKSGLRFNVRGKMDIWSLKETFIDRFYEKFGTPVGNGWKIIDIGAGIGDYTIFATYRHPGNQVYAYEPFAPSFELLRKNISINHIEYIHTFAQAVSGETGLIRLDISGGEPLQVSSTGAHQAVSPEKQTLVPSTSLADALKSNNIERCDLIKLDCEGAEFDILFSAEPEILKRVDRIVLEYHDYVTGNNHRELAEYLRESGYKVRTTPNYVHADLGYLYAER